MRPAVRHRGEQHDALLHVIIAVVALYLGFGMKAEAALAS